MIKSKLLAAAFAITLAMPAFAHSSGMSMPGMLMASGATAEASPSTEAFKASTEKMMKNIDRPMNGNADQDFVAGMLPHHVGAVDMAKVEIQYGKDPKML